MTLLYLPPSALSLFSTVSLQFFPCPLFLSHSYSVIVGWDPGYRHDVIIHYSSDIFPHLSFPADGTYFRTSWSFRPLPLVVSSVCVRLARPPPCLRLIQVKPQPFYHRPIPCLTPLTPLDNIFFLPSQQQRLCIKQHAVKKARHSINNMLLILPPTAIYDV